MQQSYLVSFHYFINLIINILFYLFKHPWKFERFAGSRAKQITRIIVKWIKNCMRKWFHYSGRTLYEILHVVYLNCSQLLHLIKMLLIFHIKYFYEQESFKQHVMKHYLLAGSNGVQQNNPAENCSFYWSRYWDGDFIFQK